MSRLNAQDEQQFEMVMVMADFLKSQDTVAGNCDDIAMGLYESLKRAFGGCNVYFKKGIAGQADEEGRQMLDDLNNGLNIYQIAHKYQKTCQTVYKKLSKARDEQRKHNNAKYGEL